MNVRHEEVKRKGTFFVEEKGERVGEIGYFHSAPGKINIYHTEVVERLRRKGVGGELIKAVIDYARENGLQIVATCPYARKVIEGTREYRELLVEE